MIHGKASNSDGKEHLSLRSWRHFAREFCCFGGSVEGESEWRLRTSSRAKPAWVAPALKITRARIPPATQAKNLERLLIWLSMLKISDDYPQEKRRSYLTSHFSLLISMVPAFMLNSIHVSFTALSMV